jgi:Na+/H+ antiporter NhaD/arsenite permease-like protein
MAHTDTLSLWWHLPFALILLSIAILPALVPHWWEKRYAFIVLPLGAVVALRYLLDFQNAGPLFAAAHEYVSFIVLIGALYVVAGGIHIGLLGVLTPRQNLILLVAGAVLANVLGTTGASMVLIRPYLRGNRWRIAPFHIVFFIFIVSNCGGALTPIGDPPLFLGYLMGVPFFWVLRHLWFPWIIAIGLLLSIFYVLDVRHYRRQSAHSRDTAERPDRMTIEGKLNFFFLGAILAAVIGVVYLPADLHWTRDAIVLGAAVASYLTTPKRIHERNDFNFHPVREVAILFAGIFAAMVPVLEWLTTNAPTLGLQNSTHFYWATGVTSAFLDNAPAYLNFAATAMGLEGLSIRDSSQVAAWAASHPELLQCISAASVFFGAATYIGNAPNFMVKAICQHYGAKPPGFFEYIYKYTLPILLPVLIVLYFLVR